MQKVLRDEYEGDVHISTGVTTKEEIENIVIFWEEGKGDAKNRLILYNCTSGYPVPFEDVCLLELRELYAKYKDRVKYLGFSGHHLGIAVDVAAYAMGATWKCMSLKATDILPIESEQRAKLKWGCYNKEG